MPFAIAYPRPDHRGLSASCRKPVQIWRDPAANAVRRPAMLARYNLPSRWSVFVWRACRNRPLRRPPFCKIWRAMQCLHHQTLSSFLHPSRCAPHFLKAGHTVTALLLSQTEALELALLLCSPSRLYPATTLCSAKRQCLLPCQAPSC